MNARGPSTASALRRTRSFSDASSAKRDSLPRARTAISLAVRTATGGAFRAIPPATSTDRSSSVPAGTTSLTRPARTACAASMWSPVRSSCIAIAHGTCCGRRTCVPPPGTRPQRTSGSPNIARSDAIRMSVPSSISKPPPARHRPFTAAMMGVKTSEKNLFAGSGTKISNSPAVSRGGMSCPRSPPALNARLPAPVRTMARTWLSVRASSIASANCRSIGTVSAL